MLNFSFKRIRSITASNQWQVWTRRYFADLIIAYLQDVLALTLLTPAPVAAAPRLTPPMFPGNDGAGAAVCLKGEAFRQTVASMQVWWPSFHVCCE